MNPGTRRYKVFSPDSAITSAVMVMVGLLGAIVTMPADTIPAGALRMPGLLFSLGLLAGPLLAVIRHGIEYIFRIESVICFAIFYFLFLDIVQGIYPVEVSRDATAQVFYASTIFVVAMHLMTLVKPRRLPQPILASASVQYKTTMLTSAMVLCFCFGMFYFALMTGFSPALMLHGLGAGRFSAPWARGGSGGWFAFVEHMVYFGYLLPSLAVLMALREGKWFTWRVVLGVVLSGIFLPFVMQGGGRRIFGMCVGAAVFTWMCYNRRRIGLKQLIVFAVLMGGILVTMELMLGSRNSGAVEFSYTLDEFQYVRVDDNFLRFAQNLEIVPALHPHTGFQWVFWTLARPIPRVLWPGKPMDSGFDLSETLGITASLSCTSISEWYVAFGWMGLVVGGSLYGYLSRFWSQLLEHNFPAGGILVFAMGMMAIVVSIRSMFELILMSYPLLAWLLVNRFLQRKTLLPAPAARRKSSVLYPA